MAAVIRGIPFDQASVGRLSTRPGVYLFHGERGEVLYVGKAKSLRVRVRSYLAGGRSAGIKTRELVRAARSVETLVVASEEEALILEANLIKEHQPRFNIQLRDDKKYPYVKVTVDEPFPRAYVTRRVREDGSRYFGPFVSVGRVRRALDLVKRTHGVRSCRYDLPREAPSRPCLDHHIGRCAAPCVGLQSEEHYRHMIDRLLRVLGGDVANVQAEVEQEMHKASSELDFERAALLRDVLAGLDGIARRQRVHVVGGGDQDVVGIARDGQVAAAVTLLIRGGVLIGRDTLTMSGVEDEAESEIVARSVSHAYLSHGTEAAGTLPREVLLPADFEDRPVLEKILSGRAARKVAVRVPRRGAKVGLVELAVTNARHSLSEQVRKGEVAGPHTEEVLYELQDRLGLKVVPRLIVCFDISHTQGAEAVASAVLFENGEPCRSGYRHMKIRGDFGNDDYRSMEEAVRRYFDRKRSEEGPLPDLALIDGGRGQLGAARAALEAIGLEQVAVAALAKRQEEVYLPGCTNGLRLPRTARSLLLLQRVRDEAHRFAVRYNRKLRSRRTVRSRLGDIPGIGPRRQQALLSRFGSLRGVKEATAADIGRIPGFSEAMGARVLAYLNARTR
ncbi:MAG: excinuclease ABC subunit UvrC [Gemmatimonadetes bacterium]|nr:excinuclease ABC subunit UvrC [Gemmatimonadota bacterium]MYH53012.1 excinuclease ABC subunit UvrC [Gemmatimonadota bacterium]MYK66560.1 excinuclease ABC subunit UvrC [Gemmatimonadota bacterium]